MSLFPDLAAFAKAHPACHGNILALAYDISEQSHQEVAFFNQQLNQHKLAPAKWSITLAPQATAQWQLQISAQEANQFVLNNSMSLAASALSVVLELQHLQDCAEQNKIVKTKLGRQETSLDKWFSDKQNADEFATTLALDTSLLGYFHQVSQILFGHCSLPETSLVERRALITDADFNAGSMFCLWLQYHQNEQRKPVSTEAALHRLVNAGYLLGVIQKSQSKNKNALHYAAHRVSCLASGAQAADQVAYEEASLQQSVSDASQWIEAALRDSSLADSVGSESELSDDADKLEQETAPCRAQLKSGPLQQLAF
ncbi:hypothetical protein [Motilimonas pumila]|uniref:Uncharacterized protein n=1 Tax=Motilimonas pumila TaxID=2303987 RepID=A0A418YHH8_9GAMM|nr:hypothetical protein [Motilimonas pumila]RJG49525.1 hypothetical protein D1Z90_06090 [Motilimonas pumila]